MRQIPNLKGHFINKKGEVYKSVQSTVSFDGHMIVRIDGVWHKVEELMANSYFDGRKENNRIIHLDNNIRNNRLENLVLEDLLCQS